MGFYIRIRFGHKTLYSPVDETETATVNNAKAQLKEMQSLGIDAAYLEIEKGTHMSMIKPAIPEIFKFFDKHRKAELEFKPHN